MAEAQQRPGKRIRQACEPCRRKKTRCPGEKPKCSFCERLQQTCTYTEEPSSSIETPEWAEKFQKLDQKLNVILDQLGSPSTERHTPSRNLLSSPTSRPHGFYDSTPRRLSVTHRVLIAPEDDISSPHQHPELSQVVELYAYHCHCQPLPIFQIGNLRDNFKEYSWDVLFAILAIAVRFLDTPTSAEVQLQHSRSYAEKSWRLIMSKFVEGAVELSTLQALCLLIFVDLTNGNVHRASASLALGQQLGKSARLDVEHDDLISPTEAEERRCCFWSFHILGLMCKNGTNQSSILKGCRPQYPQSSKNDLYFNNIISRVPDPGILAHTIQVTEFWADCIDYSRSRLKPGAKAPWLFDSGYSKLNADIMQFESSFHESHRFAQGRFADQLPEKLQANMGYWGPWLYLQFTYHAATCLLNHPFLVLESSKSSSEPFPSTFVDSCGGLALLHSNWFDIFIDMINHKSFPVSDPFLAYCASVAATIHLWYCYAGDRGVKDQARLRFIRCYKFINRMAGQWPIVQKMVSNLDEANRRASYWPLLKQSPFTPAEVPAADKPLFMRLLSYVPDANDVDDRGQMFHVSLDPGQIGRRTLGDEENARTSASATENPESYIPPSSTQCTERGSQQPQQSIDFLSPLGTSIMFSMEEVEAMDLGGVDSTYGLGLYDWSGDL